MYTTLANVNSDLQKLLDFSLDVICTVDAEHKFISVSAASNEMWGYNAEELVGTYCLDIVVEEERTATLECIELHRVDPAKNYCENHICRKDGSIVHTAWTAYWDENDQLLYCVARSIEKKKKVENLLLESEEQWRAAQKLARLGNWHLDLITSQINWSQGLYDIYGVCDKDYASPTLDGFFNLIHPDDKTSAHAELELLMKSERSDYVHRMIRPDGKTIYVRHLSQAIKDETGKIIGLAGTVQDITEQKEAEIKLALSEQKFKLLVQNGSDIISIVDEKGTFKYASPTTFAIAGYTPEELTGKNVFEMIHPEDVEQVMKKMQQVINLTRDGIPIEYRLQAKNGKWLWLESLGSNMMHEADVEGVIVTSRNVTERKRLENLLAIEHKNRQRAITSAVIKAQESERSQLGQELHDNVNQVLTTVKLYNEMLFDGIGDPKDILPRSIHHLQDCINEIRSISKRLSAPTLGKISLEDSIQELVDSINLTRRLEISLQVFGLSRKLIQQDLHLTIYRIIQEQLNNIIKYAEAKQVSIQIRNDDKALVLQITDDGKGFDTKKKRKGIGITNMETRAENMHGRLQVISEPGQGCKLIATFPPIH